ncbi:hypothetical protein BJ912DRAFT_957910 [Pholiota molesta]|nr:hypothetical protein BJ912DRAFT_957910 [Pholiota molesta]
MPSATSSHQQQHHERQPAQARDPTTVNGAPTNPDQRNMPAEPIIIQIPDFIDHGNYMMQILQETRLAQLATIEQQRELIQYVQGLHEWLERDAVERKSERENLVSRIDRLNSDILHSLR